jgi:hypothetical protein
VHQDKKEKQCQEFPAETLIPVATVKDAIHTLLGQLGTEEAGSNQGLLGGVAHTAGVLTPHPERGVRPLHVHHEAAVRQVGAPSKVDKTYNQSITLKITSAQPEKSRTNLIVRNDVKTILVLWRIVFVHMNIFFIICALLLWRQ